MGRPLNKKYFGNRNIGTNGREGIDRQNGYDGDGLTEEGHEIGTDKPLGDDGIGGKRIASISWSTLGSFRGNGAFGIDGLALPAPSLPGGVQATWALVFEVESVTTGAGNTNLAIGDTFTNTNFPGMIAKVTSLDGGAGSAVFSVTVAGASRGAELGYNELLADTQGITLTQSGGTGTAGTFLVDVNYRVKSGAINEQGSGYLGTETFTATLTGSGTVGTAPAGTIVFAADTGAVGSATNQENAIIAYVYQDDERRIADIVKQTGTRRYVFITNSDGPGSGKEDEAVQGYLVPYAAQAADEADITATDNNGKEYWVTKLTAHKAKLTRKDGSGGYVYATGQQAPWTFDSTANGRVIIQNA